MATIQEYTAIYFIIGLLIANYLFFIYKNSINFSTTKKYYKPSDSQKKVVLVIIITVLIIGYAIGWPFFLATRSTELEIK